MEKQKVHVWGFPAEAMPPWPPDLEPVPITDWPADALVVVHCSAAKRFQMAVAAQPWPDGRLPVAVLYLPRGTAAPPGAWVAFDATVQEGDWPALRALLACPQHFEMATMADELPTTFVQTLERPIEECAPEDLPLPAEVRSHLGTCRTCWDAFRQALADRLWWRGQQLCPTMDQLAAQARGGAEAQVVRHVARCQSCQAQVAVLRRELAPPWLTVPLRTVATEFLASLAEEGRQVLSALAALVSGGLQVDLVPVGAGVRTRDPHSGRQVVDLTALLGQLQSGTPVLLLRPHRDLTITWDSTRQAVRIGSLHGAGKVRITDFGLEIRRGPEVLWEARSQDGHVVVPLADFVQALQAGADEVAILAQE